MRRRSAEASPRRCGSTRTGPPDALVCTSRKSGAPTRSIAPVGSLSAVRVTGGFFAVTVTRGLRHAVVHRRVRGLRPDERGERLGGEHLREVTDRLAVQRIDRRRGHVRCSSPSEEPCRRDVERSAAPPVGTSEPACPATGRLDLRVGRRHCEPAGAGAFALARAATAASRRRVRVRARRRRRPRARGDNGERNP